MILNEDRQFPAPLAAAMAIRLDLVGEDGVDFDPFTAFLSAEETTDWFRAWTGNREVSGDEFRVFGKDGTGGYASFWLARPGRTLVEQPVVFLGSEGEISVVAGDLGAFLWLLADGFGPGEAAAWCDGDPVQRPHRELTAVAERCAPDRRASAVAVMERAAGEFPGFEAMIMRLCRDE
ncbi:hypothetical protein GCM10010387_51620 [Streptomyces inusitatus]|uniref:SMI1/KNR4 family protein n=1 Tax=Streptomyces inusitatus TaxID=68221 RepID=A0A918V0Y9_9ACTN|nr:SMI1/KNR4 family protein [Streptomyces inusitatus]GGZ50933.1 hypothetical protein GCM10010387_51620 [Streptomyces inusitatus]